MADINECSSSQCDIASTECKNVPGGFSCACRDGFLPSLECRPVSDLGLISGNIPDDLITVSASESGYSKGVFILFFKISNVFNVQYFIPLFVYRW